MQHNRQANLELSTDLDKETDIWNKQARQASESTFSQPALSTPRNYKITRMLSSLFNKQFKSYYIRLNN